LHGVTSSAATWWKVGPALAALGWDVCAIDLPGHGDGPRLRAEADVLGTLVETTASALNGPLTALAGHSLGAVVALGACARYPQLARGVFLEDPPGQSGMDNLAYAAGVEAIGQVVRTHPEAYWQRVRADNPTWEVADVDQSVAAAEAADMAQIAGALRAGLSWDLPALVAAAPVPVFVAASGAMSGSFSDQGGSALRGPDRDELRRLVPRDRFVTVDGGHSLHKDRPERVVELISGFAGELAG
jgi:pimeloyl-ACP methyl ester carboxylesterase